MDTTPSRERLIEALQSFAAELDSVPTIRAMRTDGPYSPHYYKTEFGSWHDALRAADIQPTHGVSPDVSREVLIDDLKTVDAQTERPPRRRDIEEYGEYPYVLYEEEFDSFVRALEAAGIEPDEKQYRFSSVETPEALQGSANIETLRSNGPTPLSELPQDLSTKDRQNGAWTFDMDSGATQPADPICYLHGEHAPALVIRRFFEHNPHVLEYRDSHGIKIDIKNHQSSWKEIGREIVDELVATGEDQTASFETLVVVQAHADEILRYCFEQAIDTKVATEELPLAEDASEGRQPVWGFSREDEDIWTALSEGDGLLFSARPGEFTHYVPVSETVENTDVMTELWVEYNDDGVRSEGIERPWPYVVLGTDIHVITIPEQEFAEELEVELSDEPLQVLDEKGLTGLLNTYGTFETYLRNRDRTTETTPAGVELDTDSSTQEVVDFLLELGPDDLPVDDDSELEAVERRTREDAFREGIYEIYPGCAICGELFESPDGSFDIEAAHILPKAEDGPDVLQNGLGLCSRHHWAFDHGWFEIGVDYEIRVREYPELNGYAELQQYDGEYLRLPGDEELQPHPHYIKQRNRHLTQ